MKMKLQSTISSLVLTAAVLASGGCSVLKPKSDPTQFYVLRSQPNSHSPQTTLGQSDTAIRVGPWRLPSYLSSTPIIVDSGTNRLERLDWHQWAEPLDKGISRVLAETLSERLNTPRVAIYPDETIKQTGYGVIYTVFKFEGTLGGSVILEVYWEVRERASGAALAEQRARYVIPPTGEPQDVGGYVAQMSAALDEWSEDVAQAIPK